MFVIECVRHWRTGAVPTTELVRAEWCHGAPVIRFCDRGEAEAWCARLRRVSGRRLPDELCTPSYRVVAVPDAPLEGPRWARRLAAALTV